MLQVAFRLVICYLVEFVITRTGDYLWQNELICPQGLMLYFIVQPDIKCKDTLILHVSCSSHEYGTLLPALAFIIIQLWMMADCGLSNGGQYFPLAMNFPLLFSRSSQCNI